MLVGDIIKISAQNRLVGPHSVLQERLNIIGLEGQNRLRRQIADQTHR
jgi:hypothetical protein